MNSKKNNFNQNKINKHRQFITDKTDKYLQELDELDNEVNGEMNLIMFCYNFMRTKNILGFPKMIEAIQNWKPDYTKLTCDLKNGFHKAFFPQNKPLFLLKHYRLVFFKVA